MDLDLENTSDTFNYNNYDFSLTNEGINYSCSNYESYTSLAVAEICISAIGIVLNGFAVFFIIVLQDYKKSTSHWYVLQLAVADLLFLALLPLMAHQHLTGTWRFSAWMCKVFQGAFMISYFAGIFFLSIMSFDRYISIVHPISAVARNIRTKRNALIATVAIWIGAILLSFPLWLWSGVECVCGFMMTNDVTVEQHSSVLDLTDYSELWEEVDEDMETSVFDLPVLHPACHYPPWFSYHTWLVCNFVITYVLPLSIMAVCYSLILWKILHPSVTLIANKTDTASFGTNILKRSRASSVRRSRNSSSSSAKHSSRLKQQQKVTSIVVILVVVYVLCWSPFHILQLGKINGLRLGRNICLSLNDAVTLLAYSNSVLNPVFYTFLGSTLCQRLFRPFARFRRRQKNSIAFTNATRTARTSIKSGPPASTTTVQSQANDFVTAIPLNSVELSNAPVCNSTNEFPTEHCRLTTHMDCDSCAAH